MLLKSPVPPPQFSNPLGDPTQEIVCEPPTSSVSPVAVLPVTAPFKKLTSWRPCVPSVSPVDEPRLFVVVNVTLCMPEVAKSLTKPVGLDPITVSFGEPISPLISIIIGPGLISRISPLASNETVISVNAGTLLSMLVIKWKTPLCSGKGNSSSVVNTIRSPWERTPAESSTTITFTGFCGEPVFVVDGKTLIISIAVRSRWRVSNFARPVLRISGSIDMSNSSTSAVSSQTLGRMSDFVH